jgi:hypothetical protein
LRAIAGVRASRKQPVLSACGNLLHQLLDVVVVDRDAIAELINELKQVAVEHAASEHCCEDTGQPIEALAKIHWCCTEVNRPMSRTSQHDTPSISAWSSFATTQG